MAAQEDKVHMVIDIETLDIKRTAMILEVGYIVFTKDSELASGSHALEPLHQIVKGRTISPTTIAWHKDMGTDLYHLLSGASVTLGGLQEDLASVADTYKVESVWSRGSFDKDILEDAIELPFKYWQWRDCRTLDEFEKMRGVNLHDALGDCQNQMDHIRKVLYGVS